ncbi:MAG: hypothetical protein SFT92_02315 [Rickettsiales bacterium]|nr:hypothetical protein [Rickettsiales bacterium]
MKQFTITAELAQALMDYLARQPFFQVESLITGLRQGKLAASEETGDGQPTT